jgi:hypothetical protein
VRYFFYGTLRDPEIRAIVLGSASRDLEIGEATLNGWRCVYVRAQSYPVIVPAAGHIVPGCIASGIDEAMAARLAAHEGPTYRMRNLPVVGPGGVSLGARVFCPGNRARPTARLWRYDEWRARERAAYIRNLTAGIADGC